MRGHYKNIGSHLRRQHSGVLTSREKETGVTKYRTIADLIREAVPRHYAKWTETWRRLFLGGIDPLRPSNDFREFTRMMEGWAREIPAETSSQAIARYSSLMERAMKSKRARARIYNWALSQPELVWGSNPGFVFLRSVEAVIPNASWPLIPVTSDPSRGAMVERGLADARALDGEARWSHLESVALKLFARHESFCLSLVNAVSARAGFKVHTARTDYGKLIQTLAQHRPLGSTHRDDSHHFRNAFAHAHTHFDIDSNVISLEDRDWSWTGSLDDLLDIFEGHARFMRDYENALLALSVESCTRAFYSVVDFNELTALIVKGRSPKEILTSVSDRIWKDIAARQSDARSALEPFAVSPLAEPEPIPMRLDLFAQSGD